MPYVSLDNLSRFHGRLRGRASSEFASLGMANWQKTPAAGAVSFSPVPEMPLDPVVNFLFTETGPASGTKSPDNPSTITGVTQAKVTRCGKNLFLTQDYDASGTASGIIWTVRDDGTVIASGTANGNSSFWIVRNRIFPPGTYTFKCEPGASGIADCKLTHGSTSVYAKDYPITFTTTKNEVFSCRFFVLSGATLNGYEFHPQLELGSSVGAFEKGEGIDYTIDLGGTFYGGSVDLSAGTMTVTHGMTHISSFSSLSNVNTNTVQLAASINYTSAFNLNCTSNRFLVVGDSSDVEHCRLTGTPATGSRAVFFWILKSRLDVSSAVDPSNPTNAEWLAAANAWIAVNPVDFCSELLTPASVPLPPLQIYSLSQLDSYTPRINTVYSDQVSVQVGYPKSPQATQNELTNAIVSLGGNV